jgi:hypothetical protein
LKSKKRNESLYNTIPYRIIGCDKEKKTPDALDGHQEGSKEASNKVVWKEGENANITTSDASNASNALKIQTENPVRNKWR